MIYVGVIGASSCDRQTGKIAFRVGAAIAREGAVLICGGMGGVMEYACRGAREQDGVTIGILPGTDRTFANPYLSYSIPTGIAEARNSLVVRSSDALIAVGGSFGTLSEIAFALKFAKPIIGIRTWKLEDGNKNRPPITYLDGPEAAVKTAISKINRLD